MAAPRQVPVRVRPDGTFGWEELEQLLDPAAFGPHLYDRIAQAHAQAGEAFVTRAADVIADQKPYAPNAPLTVALKGSTTPLIRHGDLVGSLTYHVDRDRLTLRMGVRSRKLRSGRYLAEVLHNGATIHPTPAMRRAVFAALRAKLGAAGFRAYARSHLGGPAKPVWVIPGRPFLTTVWHDPAWQEVCGRAYARALDGALRDTLGGPEAP